jgi:hypothetical protein
MPCGVSHYPTHSYTRLGTAGTIAAPLASTWRQDHTPPIDGYGCLPGAHYSVVLSLTQHCAGTACAMKVVRPTTNEEGCLWTQNTVTPHQFYAVPGNKKGNLISDYPTYITSYVKVSLPVMNSTMNTFVILTKTTYLWTTHTSIHITPYSKHYTRSTTDSGTPPTLFLREQHKTFTITAHTTRISQQGATPTHHRQKM